MFGPVEDSIDRPKEVRIRPGVLQIIPIEFDQHACRIPSFGIVQSGDIRSAPIWIPGASQRFSLEKAGLIVGGECLCVIGQ